jgi:peptidoglycan/LPS O-acetylase OafA/YrhL
VLNHDCKENEHERNIKGRFSSQTSAPVLAEAPGAQYNVAIGYLRAFVTVLVVAHHAALAYHPFAPPPPATLLAQPRWWPAFPVVDAARWGGFGLLVGFNDVFFMSLMFFLSGLFVWKSLRSKGSRAFLRDRTVRLGIPFVIAAAVIAPLAYYPAYLTTLSHSGLAGFWRQWLSLGNWPAGPAWFIWVLLAFDCLAAALFLILPKWGETLGRLLARASHPPAKFFGVLLVISAIAYIPMALGFNSFAWISFGPFFLQTSRILHYFVYFLIGAGVGVLGTGKGLLASDGKLARRWWLWTIVAGVAFSVYSGLVTALFTPHPSPRLWETLADFAFVLSCAASCFAFLAVFLRFARRRIKIWDSLTANAYGIYLVHYAFVSWLQYALLRTTLPAIAKGWIVLLGALMLSWGVVAGIRRIPSVARVRQTSCRTGHSNGPNRNTYFAYSFFTTSPPFITNFTCCNAVMSCSGSPSTAMMSANLPGSRVPTLSVQPRRSASLMVAVWIACIGLIPRLT